MLIQGERQMRERGVALHLVGLSPSVLAVVRRSSLGETLGHGRMHYNLQRAVRQFLAEPSLGLEPTAPTD
jgi:hypothetical protein